MRGDQHLQLLRAEFHLVLCSVDQAVDVVVGKPERHIRLSMIAEAAEQRGDGLAGDLAVRIPERDVDAGESA